MEQLNKKIKDIYKQEQSLLPAELKWDEMKEGIFEKMKKQKDEPTPIFGFWFGPKKWWLSIAALFVVSSSVFMYFILKNPNTEQRNFDKKNLTNKVLKEGKNEKTNQVTKQKKEQALKPLFKNNTKENTTTELKNLVDNDYERPLVKPTTKNNNILNSQASKKIKSSNEFPSSLTKPNLNTKTNQSILNNEKTKATSTNIIVENDSDDELESSKTILPLQTSLKNETSNSSLKKDKTVASKTSTNKFNVVKPLEKKTSILASLNKNLLLKEANVNPSIKKPVKQKESYNVIQLDAGFTYLFSQYKKLDSLQFNFETGFPSNYINVGYSKIFTNGIYVSAGLNYSRYKTKFELNDTITHTYLIKNAHTFSTTNILTGKISDVYEDVEIQARSSRKVRHYNYFSTLSIPLIIGKQFSHKKFSYNIGLGSDVSIYNSSEGKTLRDNEVITYSKSAGKPYHNKTQFSTLVNFSVALSINKNIKITSNLRYKNSITNWAKDELSVKPQALLFGAGLKFKL